ncbi:MAG: Myosin heavy chain [Ignavibacteria bacterium]|nr:Myosin heavy chain [Ignavibacteria bacterium]
MANPPVKKLTTTNTKQEMLESYNKLVESLEAKKENEIKAAEKIEIKQVKAALEVADSISVENINKKIAELKYEFSTNLSTLSEKIEQEFVKYQNVKKAVIAKEKELEEIFDIQKNAESLYALLEAQSIKKEEFLEEMDDRKFELENEITEKRKKWEAEKLQKEIDAKEREKQESAARTREKEEYTYNFKREQQIAKDKFESEKASMIKELDELREKANKDLALREKNILESEAELKELRAKAAEFPKELARSIDKAVKDATEKIITDAKHKEELLISSYDGEKKSMAIRIETLEKTIKEHNDLINKLSGQLEKSYTQIQDIATKAVAGSSNKQQQVYPQSTGKTE